MSFKCVIHSIIDVEVPVRRSSRPKKSKFALVDGDTFIFTDENAVFEKGVFQQRTRKKKV